jgi:hypothetical protein
MDSDWTVIRRHGRRVVKTYGPMPEDVARFVGQRAAEKHPGHTVIVLPPRGRKS